MSENDENSSGTVAAARVKPPRYLTKSRFKLALECPTKLYYTGKKDYLNTSSEDSFLAALAQGGYQIGALACLMYPGGIAVEDQTHAEQVARTSQLLKQENVTIYEAAFQAADLFVRVDILCKVGNQIDLIEVKAKSFNSDREPTLRGTSGGIQSAFLPYLQDIAFQKYTADLAYPDFEYCSFLLMADTAKTATVDGLNQRFPIQRSGDRIHVTVAPGTDAVALGGPILTAVCVDSHVEEILMGNLEVGATTAPFPDAVKVLAEAYLADGRITPVPGAACGSCEFKSATPPKVGEPRSGFHECWKQQFDWQDDDFASGTVLDLWNFRGKDALIAAGVLRPSDLTPEHLKFDGSEPGRDGMTPRHRQWYQSSGQWPGGGAFFLDRVNLGRAMEGWTYPLHFIDFETCTVPIPFTKGRRPYETIAFQFSHHTLDRAGCTSHKTQFLNAAPGQNPNVAFLRALRAALSDDNGTIFRWAAHENTVLNQLRRHLLDDPKRPEDADELVTFIASITSREETNERGKEVEVVGARSMVDLCKLAEKFYFHPNTRGSSSLKKVLPALMGSSPFLRERYGRSVYGTAAMPSLNHTTPMTWWQLGENGQVCDPYRLLPPVFSDLSREKQEEMEEGLPAALREGGAAMAAYASLQSETLSAGARAAMESALLRYCELDTLAMVMAVQAWDSDCPQA